MTGCRAEGCYFNPLSPHGERPLQRWPPPAPPKFQSTLPAWGETPRQPWRRVRDLFQSTLPAWGETHELDDSNINIIISIHSPRMGRDQMRKKRKPEITSFQSTLPAWGETALAPVPARAGKISIHSPRMGRDNDVNIAGSNSDISIHSPRMGRDLGRNRLSVTVPPFQSTLPAWGETTLRRTVSIRAGDFNPLSPHGERPGAVISCSFKPKFQSTLPAWGETENGLCGGYDPRHFNPLSPHGERLLVAPLIVAISLFQSTLPAWGET